MTDLNIRGLVEDIRVLQKKIDAEVERGRLVKAEEVKIDSFVQVLQWVRLTEHKEPVTWTYYQGFVNGMVQGDQDVLIGAFINERVGREGQNKIIGIYDPKE